MMRALLWEVYKLEQRGGNAWTSGRAVPFSRHLWWNVGEDSQASGGRAGGGACGDARASQGNGEDLVGLTSPPPAPAERTLQPCMPVHMPAAATRPQGSQSEITLFSLLRGDPRCMSPREDCCYLSFLHLGPWPRYDCSGLQAA